VGKYASKFIGLHKTIKSNAICINYILSTSNVGDVDHNCYTSSKPSVVYCPLLIKM